MSGTRARFFSWLLLALTPAGLCGQSTIRRPLGVYVKIDVETAIAGYPGSGTPTTAQLHSYFQSLLASLLGNPAISGVNIGQRWDNIQPTSAAAYDWSYIDDAFTAATAVRKTVQLILTPGFDTPAWLLKQIPSCDPLFSSGSAAADCGKVTFLGYPEQARADGNVLPLPWNSIYQAAWGTFLTQLNARYGSNPAFVALAIAGPVGASDEMIFPNNQNTTVTQPSGLSADDTWAALIQHSFPNNPAYQNNDQAFIDTWEQAIDLHEKIFSGITLFIGADAGNDFPFFGKTATPHADNTLYAVDCAGVVKQEIMSCEAKTEVLSYFVTVSGPNGKGTQTGGMTASVPKTPGDIGVAGVKVLSGLNPPPAVAFSGGAEFDFPVSSQNLQAEGCAAPSGNCPGLTPEQAAYNVLTVFFYGTPAAASYGGVTGAAPIQYLDISYQDLQYAQANACPPVRSTGTGSISLQDLYNRASHDLYAMANQVKALAPPTCSTSTPAPTITLIANAEGENPVIAPNTWVEIKGANLAPSNDTRTWQTSDFIKGQMPTNLDGVSVTVNGKAAYVYYISPSQINILTPPDALPAAPQVVVNDNGASVSSSTSAAAISPSFFVLGDGQHAIGVHTDGSLIGPASLSSPGYPFRPAQPGETVLLFANGFGPTNQAIVSGSSTQSGTLAPLPSVTIGGVPAAVGFAGLISPGLFQFNVTIPNNAPGGDEPLVATYAGGTTQSGLLLILTGTAPPTSVGFYVSPSGNDAWSGTLAASNSAGTDGPFATFEHARASVAALNKTGLTQIHVQFRGGTYYLPATEMMTAADSGSATLTISYENFPGESPVFSGGVRIQNWTNVGGNTWKATLPASTQYFENLFYNGARRLRPRLGGALGTYFRYVGPVYLQGAAPPANPPDPNCSEYFAGSGWECFDRFQYAPADPISASWKNLAPAAGNHCNQPAGNANLSGDIELVNFEQYSVSKLRLSCVDTSNHIVYLTGATATEVDHPTSHGFIPNHRYLIENVEDSLSLPGQWFLDRSSKSWTLTYLANSDENPNSDEVIAPQVPQLLVASALQYVTFRGLTFQHDNYTMPVTGYGGDSGVVSALSFQNSQHITVDSITVAQTSGTGLEFISCIDHNSPKWCVAYNTAGVSASNIVENSAFYDLAAAGIRIGVGGHATDTNANVPQFHTVQNTVIEGYGRVYADSKGIDQGQAHDNLYTHNDVYDGYKVAIKVCYCSDSDVNPPFTNNNVVSFNHVHDLFQGIMNDSGSIYFGVGTPSPPQSGTGNKMLNNKVHDVNDASVMDADGYGGDGLYADDFSGQVDIENNLVYRVSGNAISFSGPRAGPGQSSTVRNNILAFARQSMLNAYDPYSFGTTPPQPMFFTASSNILYFDRAAADSFFVQGGCTYAGEPYPNYEVWSSNVFWRTDGAFAADAKAFHVQQGQGAANICGNKGTWTNYTFAGWQSLGEDGQSVVQNPGFNNPAYPADDFSLPKGSPGFGFVVFDPNQAGRTNAVIKPPAVAATFPTKLFNPATDF
ncbi:MAG TPA: hypothetical protein VKU19_09910 [Bryobacteraceae bacterium]|nr:hypothetical protein [Bryobacteraceae bacterium]